jgi:aldehyde:ferredoxin oxidoreductase
MDLFDQGILTREDTGGIDLHWGNDEAMETLIYQIVRREGLGDILSRGVRQAAWIIDKGAEKFAYHAKGLELSGSDPRGLMGTALGYAVALRGGDFPTVYALPEYRWSPEKAEKELGSRKVADRFSTEGKGVLIKRCMVVCAALDSLGICKVPVLSIIGDFDLKSEAALAEALTGWSMDYEDLYWIGERVVNLERLFNLRHGATADDDRIPDRFLQEAIAEGPGEGRTVDFAPMVKDFYSVMGWSKAGIPSESKLKSLGLPTDRP